MYILTIRTQYKLNLTSPLRNLCHVKFCCFATIAIISSIYLGGKKKTFRIFLAVKKNLT